MEKNRSETNPWDIPMFSCQHKGDNLSKEPEMSVRQAKKREIVVFQNQLTHYFTKEDNFSDVVDRSGKEKTEH